MKFSSLEELFQPCKQGRLTFFCSTTQDARRRTAAAHPMQGSESRSRSSSIKLHMEPVSIRDVDSSTSYVYRPQEEIACGGVDDTKKDGVPWRWHASLLACQAIVLARYDQHVAWKVVCASAGHGEGLIVEAPPSLELVHSCCRRFGIYRIRYAFRSSGSEPAGGLHRSLDADTAGSTSDRSQSIPFYMAGMSLEELMEC